MENSKNNQHGAISEVLSVVKALSNKTDKKFDEVFETIGSLSNKTDKKFDEVFETMNDFASQTEERFNQMATKNDLADLESRMVTVDKISDMESRLTTRFVTKDYLDDKLADQTAEIFSRLDKRQDRDKNFKEILVGVMKGHTSITSKEEKSLKDLI